MYPRREASAYPSSINSAARYTAGFILVLIFLWMNSPKLPRRGPSKLPPTATSFSEKCVNTSSMNDFGNLIGYCILPGQISAPTATPPLTLNVARPVRVRTNRALSGRLLVSIEANTSLGLGPAALVISRFSTSCSGTRMLFPIRIARSLPCSINGIISVTSTLRCCAVSSGVR